MSTIECIAKYGPLSEDKVLREPLAIGEWKNSGEINEVVNTEIFMKTAPLSKDFCHSVAQLQVITVSRNQGFVGDETAGSYSWFEVIILANDSAKAPRVKDGRILAWRSHSNRVGIRIFRHTLESSLIAEQKYWMISRYGLRSSRSNLDMSHRLICLFFSQVMSLP